MHLFSNTDFIHFKKILSVDSGPVVGNQRKIDIRNPNSIEVYDQKQCAVAELQELHDKTNSKIGVEKKLVAEKRREFKDENWKMHEIEQNPENDNQKKFQAQSRTKFENENLQNLRNASEVSQQSTTAFKEQSLSEDENKSNVRKKVELLIINVAQHESKESEHYSRIPKSLIKFLKFVRQRNIETDFKVEQVVELTRIFQRVIKIKSELLERLLEMASNLRQSKPVQIDEVEEATKEFECLQEFNACINLEVIAKRLSSSKVRADAQ